MHRRLIASLVWVVSAHPASAQVAQPLGVSVQRAMVRSAAGSAPARRSSLDLPQAERGSVWPWVGVGVLGGALVGAGVAAAQVARTDDAFFPDLAVGAGVVAGALAGGLLAAIVYAIIHQ